MVTFRLKIVIAIICLVIVSLSMMETVPAAGCREPLRLAMEATGAKVEECSVNAWVKLPSVLLSTAQLEDMVQEVMSQLGISPEEYQRTYQQKNNNTIVQAEVIRKKFHALVIAQVVPRGLGASEFEGYLVVNIEAKTDENISIRHMQEKIFSITKKFGPTPQITTCLIGWLDGKLRAGEWHTSLNDAFQVIDAMIIDKLEAEHFVSYTGFTSEITDWLQVDGKRINLNMAMRYSPYDNRTYVTIGSPIITREY